MNGLHSSGPGGSARRQQWKLGPWILSHQSPSISTTLPQKQNLLSAFQTGGSTPLVADSDGKFWPRRAKSKEEFKTFNSFETFILEHEVWDKPTSIIRCSFSDINPSALSPSYAQAISFSRKFPAANSAANIHQLKNPTSTHLQTYLL